MLGTVVDASFDCFILNVRQGRNKLWMFTL